MSEASLSEIARRLRVDNFILIGKGEEYSGGRTKKAILADALEAIIGAYYLDSGFCPPRRFVQRLLIPEINKVLEDRHAKDYKTLLQEHVQKRMKTYPHYRVVQKTGPDHDRTFWIEVHVDERSYGAGKGKNKKEAEQDAARLAYEGLARGREARRGPSRPATHPDPRVPGQAARRPAAQVRPAATAASPAGAAGLVSPHSFPVQPSRDIEQLLLLVHAQGRRARPAAARRG